jgi:hypothetical protein
MLIHAVYGTNFPTNFSSKAKPLLTGMSSLEDKIAATTAKSIAGSSTLIPPLCLEKHLWRQA